MSEQSPHLKIGVAFGFNARKTGDYGDIAWSLQYVNDEESVVFGRSADIRKSAGASGHVPVVVIGLSSAHRYTAQDQKETAWAWRICKAYCEFLGFEPSNIAIKRMFELIQKMLIELCTMKPIPDALREKPEGELEVETTETGLKLIVH